MNKKHYIAITLVVLLVAIPLVVYYGMSYNSVKDTTIQIASVKRTVDRFCGTCAPYSVSYDVEAHVWSYATSINTVVNSPTFSLVVNSNMISSSNGARGTFQPYSYLIYYLTFTSYDSSIASAVGQSSSNYIVLSIDASVSAELYQTLVTLSGSSNQSFWRIFRILSLPLEHCYTMRVEN